MESKWTLIAYSVLIYLLNAMNPNIGLCCAEGELKEKDGATSNQSELAMADMMFI